MSEDNRLNKIISLDMSTWVVLVVDDKEDNLYIVEKILSHQKAHIHTASDGRQGLEVLRQIKPTLILLDISMPIIDGWQMLKAIRQNPDTMGIPVIALTAFAMEHDERQIFDAGFDGYIPKPFSIATFLSEIKRVVSQLQ